MHNLLSRVRTLEAKLLRSPSASPPPLGEPVIEMGLPDTSHVVDHPLNRGRGRGRGRSSNGRGRGRGSNTSTRGRGRFNDRRRNNGRRRDKDIRGDIDIVEEGGTDAYDVSSASWPGCCFSIYNFVYETNFLIFFLCSSHSTLLHFLFKPVSVNTEKVFMFGIHETFWLFFIILFRKKMKLQ